MKPQTSFRISEYTKAQMDKLIELRQCNQTELIAIAVDRMYREEFGKTNPLAPEQYQAAIERTRQRRKTE